jgi:hypothetical protein
MMLKVCIVLGYYDYRTHLTLTSNPMMKQHAPHVGYVGCGHDDLNSMDHIRSSRSRTRRVPTVSSS